MNSYRRQGMFSFFRAEKGTIIDGWVEGRSVKYSGARLKEKGVLISVEGITDAQYAYAPVPL